MADHYEQFGLKLLSAPVTAGKKGFYYFLKEPITEEHGLSGRKIRGTVSYHPMIQALGGAPVNMPGGDIYASLQKGVIDGAAWGRIGAKDFKWYEVADYIATPSFGQVGVMIFMNKSKFDSLSESMQDVLIQAGIELEKICLEYFDEMAVKEYEELLELGMEETSFSSSDIEKLEILWANGVWKVAEDISGNEATIVRELAKENGLTF